MKEGNKNTDNKGKEVEWARTKKVIFTERGRIPVTCHFFSQENRGGQGKDGASEEKDLLLSLSNLVLNLHFFKTHYLRRTPG